MNPMDILKNFGNIQEKLAESQQKLATLRATGTAGGDMARVTINGEMKILDIQLSPEIVDPSDIEMLTDLIRAAHSDAMNRIKDEISRELGSLTGGMNLPPGFMGMG